MEIRGDSSSETRMKIGMAVTCLLTALAMFIFLIKDEDTGDHAFEPAPTGTQETAPGTLISIRDRALPFLEEATEDPSAVKTSLDPVAQAVAVDLTARVCARSSGTGIENARLQANFLPYLEDTDLIEKRTDHTGGFRLPLAFDRKASITNVHLRIAAEGYRDLETTLVYTADRDDADYGVFYLTEDDEHLILVKDGSGRAIPGARLTFYKSLSHDSFVPALTKTSNDEGLVRIADRELALDDFWRHMVIRATAKGMADQWFDDLTDRHIPDEFIMEPAKFRSCRVTNALNGEGIPGAKVTMQDISGIFGLNAKGKRKEELDKQADDTGHVKLPIDSSPHSGGSCYTTLRIAANGYIPSTMDLDSLTGAHIPLEIPLKPTSFIKAGEVVNKRTGESIVGIVVHLHPHEPVVTDELGRFSLPVAEGEKASFRFQAPGYRPYNHTFEPLEAWQILLLPGLTAHAGAGVPVGRVRLETIVTDELGMPVAGAKVRFVPKRGKNVDNYFGFTSNAYNGGMDRVTGQDGVAIHEDRPILANRLLRMAVDCKGFVPHYSQFSVPAPAEAIERRVTLERGVLARNIRVVDRNGDPLEQKTVLAVLTPADGITMEMVSQSDSRGFCEMSVPRFVSGELRLSWRNKEPEDRKTITYDEILSQSPITLVSRSDLAFSGSIEGIVRDDSGNPVQGAVIWPELTRESLKDFARYPSQSSLKTAVTREDGTFEIPVFKGKSYTLSIHFSRGSAFWYLPEDWGAVFEGSRISISLVKAASVRVDCSVLLEGDVDLKGCKIWLESEEGDFIRPLSSNGDQVSRTFHLSTSGRMRAFLETGTGRQFTTQIFATRSGASQTAFIRL